MRRTDAATSCGNSRKILAICKSSLNLLISRIGGGKEAKAEKFSRAKRN